VGDINRPYLLIVVRPDGIPAYYGARQLLQNYNQRFGYELVDQNQKLAYPQIDPVVQTAIQRAVDEDIKERGAPPQLARSLFPSYDPKELEQTLSGGTLSGDRIGGTLDGSSEGSRINRSHRTGTGEIGEKNDSPKRNFKFVQTSQGLVKVPLNDAEMKSFARNDGSSTGSDGRFKENAGTNDDGPTEPKLIKPGIPTAGSRQVTEFPRSITNTPSKEARSGNQTTGQGADQATAANPQNDTQNMRSGDPTNQSASEARLSSLPPNAPDALTPILQERARQQLANGTGQGESNQSSGQNQSQTSQGEGGASSSGQPGPPGQGGARPSQPVKKMPFERPLRVAISDRGLRVDERDAIALPSNLKTQQLMNLTVEELRNRVEEWPAPPEQFYWRPMVKFYIYPNGEKNYERLKPYFEKQGLLSDVKYVGSIPNQEGSRN
ncbi:hypothetical protein OAF24_03445, partial [bacterium]|nr:hypothetical protein [bacterium]